MISAVSIRRPTLPNGLLPSSRTFRIKSSVHDCILSCTSLTRHVNCRESVSHINFHAVEKLGSLRVVCRRSSPCGRRIRWPARVLSLGFGPWWVWFLPYDLDLARRFEDFSAMTHFSLQHCRDES